MAADKKELRIIIAGGGTGGHIFPAIAIANALKKLRPEVKILFVGAKGRMEMEKIPQAGYEIRGLDIAGFNRSSLIKNIGLPWKLIKSFFQVRKIFKDFRPDAVIGVGGYSSFPVLRLAQQKRIDSFIHESNSFAGKSNILLGKRATKIFVATGGMEKFFPAEKIIVTGNPVRKSIAENVQTREEGIRFFGLDPSKKTVLVIGGSLCAKTINESLAANLDAFESNQLQLSLEKKNIWTGDFITKMEFAFAGADLVISRAGAMAIAELCVVAKPVVFVPYPFAAEDHQTMNAKYLVEKHAALMIKDADAKNQLVTTVIHLAQNMQQQEIMVKNIGALAVSNADEKIAIEILRSLEK